MSSAPQACDSNAGSITFVATSNQKALTANTLVDCCTPMGSIMESNKAFLKAFEKPVSQKFFGGSNPGANPQDEPRVAIIRSSCDASTLAYPAGWGLLSSIVEAYNRHHELTLRADDVWQAIITQLSFYVNANAEALRSRFVDFQGKKTLVVYMGGTFFTADYGTFARRMVDENIVKNIKDPSVASWLLPDFSTTTATDRIAASVSIMSTLQAYFEFVCCLCCGIPKVTLLGTPDDWRKLRAKVDRLPEFDLSSKRMTAWRELLVPVLDEFVRSAEGHPDISFWDRVCCRHGGGSGPSYLSGWATVFAAFSTKGEWLGGMAGVHRGLNDDEEDGPGSAFNPWPYIDFDKLPVGVVSVPVLVDDNGTQYDTHMLAGQFAYEAFGEDGTGIRPRTDWCIAYPGEVKLEPRDYKDGEVRPEA